MLSRFVAHRRAGALKLALVLSALSAAACGEDNDPGFVTDASSVGPGPGVTPGAPDAGGTGVVPVDAGGGSVNPNPTSDARVDTPSADSGGGVVAQPDSGSGTTVDASNPGQTDAGQTDAGSSGGDGGGSTTREDLGKGDGKDVITIGDSWMQYTGGGIQRGLLEASGQKYRTYALAGTKLLDEAIPRQYASAKRENPNIKTVVMTGGGNDILLGLTLDPPMTVIDKVAVRLDKLWTEMAADGVKDVVYMTYSEGGSNGPNVRYGIEKVGPVCTNHKALRCHFMIPDTIIMKQLMFDQIHPTVESCTKLGKAIFDLMVKEGMRR